MWWLRVAAGAHFDVTDKAIESFGFRVYELAIVTARAVLEDLIAVLHRGHLLKLKSQDPLVLLIVEKRLEQVVVEGLLGALRAPTGLLDTSLMYILLHVLFDTISTKEMLALFKIYKIGRAHV